MHYLWRGPKRGHDPKGDQKRHQKRDIRVRGTGHRICPKRDTQRGWLIRYPKPSEPSLRGLWIRGQNEGSERGIRTKGITQKRRE